MQFNNSCILQLFGCPSTWSARALAFYGSKLSLLLAGRCMLGCGAVGCSRACDVWGGIAWAVLGRLCWWRGRGFYGVDRALRLLKLG